MSKKSKPKKLPDLSKQDILTPIDLTQLGTNGDVCFGIGYDLSTKETNRDDMGYVQGIP